MQASDQNTEKLHQQASAHYLQGNFAEALAVWRQILAADPEDEKAAEGLRLCELLTGEGTVEDEAIEFEVPDLAIDLPALDDASPAAAPPAEESVPPHDPSIQAQGMELGDEPETLGLAASPPIPEADVEFEPPPGDAAGNELQRRVRDLMREANEAYGSGDHDAARGVLARVFILDETDEEALALQETLEGCVPPATEQVDVADLDAPEHRAAPGEFDLASDNPDAPQEAPEPEPEPEQPYLSAATNEEALHHVDELLDEPLPEFEQDEAFAADLDEQAAAADGKRIRLPQFDVQSSGKRRIVLGAAVVLFAVVGAGLWMKLQGTAGADEPAPLDAVQAEAQGQQPATDAPPAGAAEPRSGGDAGEAAASGETVPVDVEQRLADGRAALDSGDYAAAMVAFHAVVQQDPAHLEANERLQAATDGYKRQQAVEKEWLAATSLFRDGEYRSAMKMFYRLKTDDAESAARLDRYKVNGWYNMGVQALRSSQCDLARSHLSEAAQIDAHDPDVATALALCDSCDSGASKTGFQRALDVLETRALDD